MAMSSKYIFYFLVSLKVNSHGQARYVEQRRSENQDVFLYTCFIVLFEGTIVGQIHQDNAFQEGFVSSQQAWLALLKVETPIKPPCAAEKLIETNGSVSMVLHWIVAGKYLEDMDMAMDWTSYSLLQKPKGSGYVLLGILVMMACSSRCKD